jgi:hypothetical protein
MNDDVRLWCICVGLSILLVDDLWEFHSAAWTASNTSIPFGFLTIHIVIGWKNNENLSVGHFFGLENMYYLLCFYMWDIKFVNLYVRRRIVSSR